jgi:hypothetical protein
MTGLCTRQNARCPYVGSMVQQREQTTDYCPAAVVGMISAARLLLMAW